MLVTLAASVATQVTRLFRVTFDKVRPFASTSVPALVLLCCSILIHRIVLDGILVICIGPGRRTEVGVHARSSRHGVCFGPFRASASSVGVSMNGGHVSLLPQRSRYCSVSSGRGSSIDTFSAVDPVGRIVCRQRNGVRMRSGRLRVFRKAARDRSRRGLVLCLEKNVSTDTGQAGRGSRRHAHL
jgi:hypothetical protein